MIGRKGVTFLEVVLAGALFAGLSTVMFTAYDSLRRASLLERERLNATEVAHRLLLIYAHDGPGKLPDQRRVIRQGQGAYRYLLSEDVLLERDNRRDDVTVREAKAIRSISANQKIGAGVMRITIRVFPDEETAVTDPSIALAELSRVFDPFDPGSQDDVLLNHVLRMLPPGTAVPAEALQ